MSVTESPLQLAVLAVVAACLVTAGAFLAFGGDEQTAAPEPVGQNASERYSSVDSVSANVTTVFRGPNETTRTEMVVKMRPGTGYFYQRVIDHETLGTREIYANGSVLSIYDPEENEVTRLNGYSEQTVSGNMSERLGKLFSEINEQRGASDGDGSEESVSPLPSLPADTTTSGPADNASAANVAEYDVTYLGTDTVDGRDAHVVRIDGEFRDRGPEVSHLTQTLWIDTEWYVPLRNHQEWESNGETYELESTYSNVEFNAGLDDSTFEFERPEDATVIEQEVLETEYGSPDELRASAAMTLPTPDLPSDFSFQEASRTAGTVRTLSMTYENDSARIIVSKQNSTEVRTRDYAERITVDGRTVRYTSVRAAHIASWDCGGDRYTVLGRGISRSMLLDVVASVECETSGEERTGGQERRESE
jgi:outer membrane lipoprotein-sorting protein